MYCEVNKVGIVDLLKLNLCYIWLHNSTPAAVFITLNFCFLVCFNKFNPVPSTVSCISFLAILLTLESNSTRYIYTGIIILESSRSLPSFGIRGRTWYRGSYLVELCSATFAVIFRSLLQTALKLKKEAKSNLFLLVICSYSFFFYIN